ncbi:hypothetical protein Ahy_A10g048018 isoform A [Arachis hypogaea]|uniref:Uncharacterized protein n=1 Tax=Arachis hypogaea TaxID=3818 RepID=A0A445B418_ARAHY|nr:hypothetical protein Ahy_A10g048018 isoform A [Arachis hypogaea]
MTDEIMTIAVDNEQDCLMFKRIFILSIQMAFLLPTTINKISHVHLAPIFKMDIIKEENWGAHVLNFIIKDITDYNLKKKKTIDGCLFALMIVYFHLSKNKDKKGEERPPQSWIANWTKEQLVERMRAEMDEHMLYYRLSSKLYLLTCSFMHVTVRSEIGTEKLEEFLRESNKEKSAAQGEKEVDLQSTEGQYVSSETMIFLLNNIYSMFIIPEVNLRSDDPLSQGHTDQSSVNKPAESILSVIEESPNDQADENMMVVWEETQSQTEALSILPIQVCLPLSQTTPMPQIEQIPITENEPTPMPENEPTPVPEIEPTPAKFSTEKNNEGTTKSTPEPPPKPEKSTPTLSLAPSKINPASEDAAILMMMARTTSYIPKEGLRPSFSIGLTDSSQEEAATQEGQRAKTPETPKLIEQLRELVEKITGNGVKTEGKTPPIYKQSGKESFEKFETPAWTNEMTTRVKTYADGNTNEYDTVCTLNAQDQYILSKIHFAFLQVDTHIETEIVSAMCLILNQQKIIRFQEEIYCLSPDIVNMAITNHPEGVFLQPKTNKPFRVEDYPTFIPFLNLKKLASHRYVYAPLFIFFY